MANSKTKQASKTVSIANASPTIDRSDFDRWAEAVKVQMLNCLHKNKRYE